MATFVNVQERCAELVEKGVVNKYSFETELKTVYKTCRASWKYTSTASGRTRKWGSGVNENFDNFKQACALLVFNVVSWPTQDDTHIRDFMHQYSVPADNIAEANYLISTGYWEAFTQLRATKARSSWQYFDDVSLFCRVVKLTGNDMIGEHVRQWTALKQLFGWQWDHYQQNVPITDEYIIKAVRLIKAGYSRYRLSDALFKVEDELIDEVKEYAQSREIYEYAQRDIIPKEKLKQWFRHITFARQAIEYLNKITKFTYNPAIEAIQDPMIQLKLYAGLPPARCLNYMNMTYFTNQMAHDYIYNYGTHYLPKGKQWKQTNEDSLVNWERVHQYVAQHYNVPVEVFTRLRNPSILLIEWVSRKWQNTAMTKQRTMHGPGGETRDFTFLDIIDELTAADLVNGINTKPDVAFQRSAARLEQMYQSSLGARVDFPPTPFRGNQYIKFIDNSVDLIMEGKSMRHCVGGYVRACLTGSSLIYHVDVNNHISTFEIGPDHSNQGKWRLVQNRTVRDAKPHKENWDVVITWCVGHGIKVPKEYTAVEVEA